MNRQRDQLPPLSPGPRKKQRIETQIHRRLKAKATSPLQSEWDMSQPGPPSQLRMSPSRNPPPALLKPPKTALGRSVPQKDLARPKN
ncbi:MAG: hypothetical protein ACT4OL_01805 [Nitrospiraceae bacterium]